MRIGEVPISTKYFSEASQINFKRSVKYGFAILNVMIKFLFFKAGLIKYKQFVIGPQN
jgi:hypothetical protein